MCVFMFVCIWADMGGVYVGAGVCISPIMFKINSHPQ